MNQKTSRPAGSQAADVDESGLGGQPLDSNSTTQGYASRWPSEQDKRAFRRELESLSDADLLARWRFEADEIQRLIDASADAGLVGIEAIKEGMAVHEWRRAAVDVILDERKRMAAGVLVPQNTARRAGQGKDGDKGISLLSADEILSREFPEPVWAVPGLLPVGLTILAGAPKIGKSFLALQIALSVATGGRVFGEPIAKGCVLYLALEDTPRRLQDRMKKQSWPLGLAANFLCLGQFDRQVGDLRNGGGERLARQIERDGYRFVVIDTLSRSVHGDQNDASQMTRSLAPIQQIAHAKNVALLLIDHHRKNPLENPDVITDILGSTAKGAMADTILGLYRERGKGDARLRVTGRDVEEKTLRLRMDFVTGCWQCEGDAVEFDLTERRREILDALSDLGEAPADAIAQAIGADQGNTHRRLQELVANGLAVRIVKGQRIYYRT